MDLLQRISRAAALLFLVVLSSCASYPERPHWDQSLVYIAADKPDTLHRFAPLFVIEDAAKAYNRIGTPVVSLDKEGEEVIQVEPEESTFYTSKTNFVTERGKYTNLLYRIHFPSVPFGLFPFYLGAGDNVGLLVVATLNSRSKPVLYTFVHTCGCYLAFVPTSYLPEDSFRAGWQKERQIAYGENLPAYLQYSKKGKEKLVVHIRDGSHRVKNVWLSSPDEISKYIRSEPQIESFEALEKLKLPDGNFTSFFEESGSRMGYVKGSHKIWERTLMSWWAFDWRIGEDKKLGGDKSDGIVFYTSLKPWAREESDMRDFTGFLRYWGWNL